MAAKAHVASVDLGVAKCLVDPPPHGISFVTPSQGLVPRIRAALSRESLPEGCDFLEKGIDLFLYRIQGHSVLKPNSSDCFVGTITTKKGVRVRNQRK